MQELNKKQKKATAESLLEEAKTCARKLCAYGGCTTKYSNCVDKTRIGKNAIKPFGKGKTCPLAKYNIPTDTTPYIERLRSGEDPWPSDDEYFAACANCRHAKI